MRTTNKKNMEQYYALNAEDLRPVVIYTGETVYISKKTNLSGDRLIRMYFANGRAMVEKRYKCVEYTPIMLHPENIRSMS